MSPWKIFIVFLKIFEKKGNPKPKKKVLKDQGLRDLKQNKVNN